MNYILWSIHRKERKKENPAFNKNMGSCFDLIIFFLCALLTNFSITTTAQSQPATYMYHFCQGENYTDNSAYQNNLDSALFSLLLSTRGELQRKIMGSSPNTAYGFLQCRGGVSRETCANCKDTAIKEITSERCPISKQAIIWYDDCTLRYSDRSFFGIMQDSPSVYMWSPANVTVNPARFIQSLSGLLDDLIIESVSRSRNITYFATADRNLTSSEKVYGMVDCTVDINPISCNRCLRRAITEIPRCCDGKQGGRIMKPSCYFRFEMYPFFRTNKTQEESPPPYIPLSLIPPPPSESPLTNGKVLNKTRIYIITIPIVAAAALVSAFVFYICFLRRKAMREKAYRIYQTSMLFSEERSHKHNEIQRDGADVPFVDFETILTATDNFSNSNKLGQGGFGPVYKGTFKGGQEMAVKRLSRSSGQGLEEFRNEVLLIAKLQHRNLVKLLAYCIKEEEKVLLYEYMPNKSLDTFIFDRTLCLLINWEKRLDIILGIARGILYLHQDSRLRIIHRDLKTSNVLLDEEMNPKVSDFGMARICGGTQTEGSTNRVVGTYGYMAPEYALDGLFSVKSDVYSFGVVLLEIISGKKNSGFHVSEDSLNLIGYAWRLWNENKVLDFIDNSLCEACKVDEVLKCIQVGLLCVQEDANDRPTMFSVVFMLGGEATSLPNPKQPTFVFRRNQSSTTTSSSKPESCSRNDITVSAEEGR